MASIVKYKLEITDSQFVSMPRGAKLLKVGFQKDDLFVWAMVKNLDTKLRYFGIYGTGHPIEFYEIEIYLDTVFQNNGLVWHVFDRGEEL